MNKIVILEVNFTFRDSFNTIYPVLLIDEKEMILVDCGYPNFLKLIKQAAESQSINLNKLTKIVITHHDYDHMGALNEFKSSYPNIKVVSSEIDKSYISGKEKSLRLQQAEAIYPTLPESEKLAADSFHKMLQSIIPVSVDLDVKDHDIFAWCGGTEIIFTPGHMPGHISLYLKEFKTLIAGDALVIENGELAIANPNYTLDINEAKKSIKKMLDYDIEKIICYHGGVYNRDIRSALEKLI